MSDISHLLSQPGNFAGLPSQHSDYKSSRVTVLPVPYDGTTEWHSGTRNGPRAIIEASYYLEWYDIELGKELHSMGIHTLPSIEPVMDSPEAMAERVYSAAKSLLDENKFIVMLGGEHSISYGSIKACTQKFADFSVLQLDAHTDLRDQYLGTKFGHGCVMRRALELCPVTQVGIRSMSLEEQEFINSRHLSPFIVDDNSLNLSHSDIIDSLSKNVYITIDLDVLDPSIMAAVGTPEPGGLGWNDVLSLLRAVAEKRKIVGFDLVELCPDQGPASCSFTAAKLTYKLIGYSFFVGM
ncbi:MAG: agmatinase [Dehalococcoidia bacterium]|nr:agmatinase [Dehalococcoidia bacterium]MDD5647571.1 agmatinase [Dehalococcoidia bacterium]